MKRLLTIAIALVALAAPASASAEGYGAGVFIYTGNQPCDHTKYRCTEVTVNYAWATEVTRTGAVIRWEAPPQREAWADILGYTIGVQRVGAPSRSQPAFFALGGGNSQQVSGLTPGTSYTAGVCAITTNEVEAISCAQTGFTTKAALAPFRATRIRR